MKPVSTSNTSEKKFTSFKSTSTDNKSVNTVDSTNVNSVKFYPFEIPDPMNSIIRASTPAVDEIQVIEEQFEIQLGPIIADTENVKE